MDNNILLGRIDRSAGWGPIVTIETKPPQDGIGWAQLFMDADGTPTALWQVAPSGPIHAQRFLHDQGWVALPASDPSFDNDQAVAVGGHGQIALLDTRQASVTSNGVSVPALIAQVFDPQHGWSPVSTLFTSDPSQRYSGLSGMRPVIASDGSVLATWGGDGRPLWARYTAAAGWSQPAELGDCVGLRLVADHAGNVVAFCGNTDNGVQLRRFVQGAWTAKETLPVIAVGTKAAMANGMFLFVLASEDRTLRLARVSGPSVEELRLTRELRWAGISQVALDAQGGVMILWQEEVPKEPVAGQPGFWRGPVRHLFYGRAAPGTTTWSKIAQLDGDDGVSTGAFPVSLAINDRGQAMALWAMTTIDQPHGFWLAPLP
jgi:hypothetical protein